MIKVFINGEYYITFDNQEQLDNWVQAQDLYFCIHNDIAIEYEEQKRHI